MDKRSTPRTHVPDFSPRIMFLVSSGFVEGPEDEGEVSMDFCLDGVVGFCGLSDANMV